MKNILLSSFLVFIIPSCMEQKEQKEVITMNEEKLKKIEITNISYEIESQGSIDPSSKAYRKIWSYKVPKNADQDQLDKIKVNGKATLREYFEALNNNDQKFLDNLKRPVSTPSSKSDDDSDQREGGSNTSWSISVGEDGRGRFQISNSTSGYSISEFPRDIVTEKGQFTGESKYPSPEEDDDPDYPTPYTK